jgi:YVTN family beta-propeller protein
LVQIRRLSIAASALTLLLSACDKPASETAKTGEAQPPAATTATYDVYVTNETTGNLSIIDGVTGKVKSTHPLGSRPRGLRLGLDGRTFFISLSGAPRSLPGMVAPERTAADRASDGVALFDIVDQKVVRVLKGVPDPEQVAVGGDGKVFVASEEAAALFVLDGESGRVLAQTPVGKRPEGVTLSPDGRWVYVTSEDENKVTVIDAKTFAVARQIAVGARPRTVAFSPDGSRAYIPGEADRSVTVVDTATFAVINTVTLPGEDELPMDVVVSPEGDRIYVSTGRGGHVVSLDAHTLVGLQSAETGGRPWGLALSPDGRRLYAANGPTNDVSVIDAKTMTVVGKIVAGEGPWGVAIAPSMATKP